MATPAVLYFAGVGTVVGAISLGFAGAMVLSSSQPVHKEPAAAFAKRDQPIEAPAGAPAPAQAQVATPASETTGAKPVSETTGMATTAVAEITGRTPGRAPGVNIVPATPKKVEEVVGLQFAPPQPQTMEAPGPRTLAPAPAPAVSPPETKAPDSKTTERTPEIKTTEPAAKASPPKDDDAVKADTAKKEPKVKKERKPAIAEKKKPAPTQEYVERRTREYVERRRPMEVDEDDDGPIRARSVVVERPRREVLERPRREGGFFNFLGLFGDD